MKPKSFSQKNSIFRNKNLNLYSITADFGRFSKEYFVVQTGTRVGVILEKNNSILLVKQYRYVINDYSWELPSGGVRKGEKLEDAVIRECIEETGVKCRALRHIFDYTLSTDTMDSVAHIYTCKDFSILGNFDNREILEIRWLSYQKCVEMILSREIKDIFTLVGLLIYKHSDKYLKYEET